MFKDTIWYWRPALYRDMVNKKMINKKYCSAKDFKSMFEEHIPLIEDEELNWIFWDSHAISRIKYFLKHKWLLKW